MPRAARARRAGRRARCGTRIPRRCRGIARSVTSRRMREYSARAAAAAPGEAAARPCSSRSSLQATRRSPSRIARPIRRTMRHRRPTPQSGATSRARGAPPGPPRRVSELSITSSWTSAAAWKTSSAAAAARTASGIPAVPPSAAATARNPAMQNLPRSRFPPCRARAAASMKRAASAPHSEVASLSLVTKVSTRWEIAATASGEGVTGLA